HRRPGVPRCSCGHLEVPQRRPRPGVHRQPGLDAQGCARDKERGVASQARRRPGPKGHPVLPLDRAARKHPHLPRDGARAALRPWRCAQAVLAAEL
ncbi:hypothetical protein IWQ57_002706, partial [Coemansia nantahalensis]